MKVVVTGSLGNISKPLTLELVKQGHEVTVISSKSEKQTAIEELGFEHSQSFSKLFKAKTSISPLVFRQSFN